jgi:uncharacterized membrane protein
MLLVAILILACGRALAQEDAKGYDFTPVDFPGASFTQLFGLNDKGDFVGRYSYDGVTFHGFLFHGQDGSFTAIDFPGATFTNASAINNKGQITGRWDDSAGGEHAYLLDGGVFRSFDFPDALDTGTGGINDRSDIVGTFDLGDINTGIGFLLHRGQFTSFEVPGSFPQMTFAAAINDPGQIVGFFGDLVDPDNVAHGFLLDHGRFTQIDFPGVDSATLVFGINEKGQMSGFCFCIDGRSHGFVLSSGNFVVVDFPVANSRTQVRRINSRGQIVGSYFQAPAGGVVHAFIATPVKKEH